MKVTIRDKIRLVVETDRDIEVVNEIRDDLTYANPKYQEFEKMQAHGSVPHYARNPHPRVLMDFWNSDNGVTVPRGYLHRLPERVPGHYLDERVSTENAIDIELAVTLREYQEEGVVRLLQAEQGVLRADCGSGKSVVGVGILAEIKRKSFVLVHEKKLIRQWQAELESKAVGSFTIGTFGDGKKKVGDITVGTVQTLTRMRDSNCEGFQDFASQFEVIIVDEVHHVPARTVFRVVNDFPGKYRFGLSATPKRKDRMEFRLWDTLGPIVYNVDSKVLEEEGHITSARVLFVHTGIYSFDTSWSKAVTELTKSVSRTVEIVKNIGCDVESGRTVLVLSDRVEHCKAIVALLRGRGINAELLIGEVPSKERERIRLDPSVQVVVGTTVADEGLDLPRLDTVHFTCPSNNFGKVKQRAGRIRRVLRGKRESLIYDYVDAGPILTLVASKRHDWYVGLGFKIGREQRAQYSGTSAAVQ